MNVKITEKDGKWFYAFQNGASVSKRVCRGCKSRKEAEEFVSKLKFTKSSPYLIKNIAKDMFVPGSLHAERLFQLGKTLTERTFEHKRHYIDLIIKDFGEEEINKLRFMKVQNFLMQDSHSASWKNMYIEVFCSIYDETIYKCPKPVPRPCFQHFVRHSKKCNVFTDEELHSLFKPEIWRTYDIYLFFLTTFSCGLRLGEIRGLKVKQILFKEKFLIVDGFCKPDGTRTNYCKKGSPDEPKTRLVPIPSETLRLLEDYIKRNHLFSEDFVFMKDEKPLRNEYARKWFYRAMDAAGIEKGKRKLVIHSLRFNFVTFLRRDLSLEAVRKMVGHTTDSMTDYYTRFGTKDLIAELESSREAVDKLVK